MVERLVSSGFYALSFYYSIDDLVIDVVTLVEEEEFLSLIRNHKSHCPITGADLISLSVENIHFLQVSVL